MESNFISCDWGTSSFRLRLITGKPPGISDEVLRDTGIRDLFQTLETPDQTQRDRVFGQFLAAATEALCRQCQLDSSPPILLSGMASSTIGWRELPYSSLPFALDGSTVNHCEIFLETSQSAQHPVYLISGVASDCEIMRGEECELIGLATLPQVKASLADSLVILPGTHSKHVRIQDGKVIDFSTHMTGELFDVLAQHSVLASTVEANGGERDRTAFAEGVCAAHRSGLMPNLFQTRTRSVLQQKTATSNASFLSGLLIGAELMTAIKQNETTPILLAATDRLSSSYSEAADLLDLTTRITVLPPKDVQMAAIRGHAQLISKLGTAAL